ncbi:MAG: PAS domain S-box protein [Solirubrobacteraceae bacterium]
MLLGLALLVLGASYLDARAKSPVHYAVFGGAVALLLLLAAFRSEVTSHALKSARATLADDHRTLERIVNYAPFGIALLDRGGRFVSVNPALCRMLGYGKDELQGTPLHKLIHADDHDAAAELAPDSGDGPRQLEQRFIAHDGTVIWALVTISRVSEAQAMDGFRVVQIHDITERKRVETELADERQLLNAFLETTPDQVYFKDLHSRFIRVSSAQAAKLGLAGPHEMLGKNDFDYFTEEHARPAFEDEQQIIATGTPIVAFEERETYPDGRELWVSTTKLPLRDASGTIVGTCGVSQDITARRHAEALVREGEERWRTLLANSHEVVALVNPAGLITYISPSVEQSLGWPPDELLGAEFSALVHDEDAEPFATVFKDAAKADDRRPRFVEFRAHHRDGSWHPLESTLVCQVDDPVIGAVLVTARDITDRKMLEQERERLELERRVSQRLEAVGQLSAGIAHEINTPMQFVGDSVTFLREAVDELLTLTNVYHDLLHSAEAIDRDERQRRAFEAEDLADLEYLCDRIPKAFGRTVDGIDRVTSIVSAMKRFSHTSSAAASPADLNEAIETTLAVCRNEYKYVADIELALGELPVVTCNIGELNQVFLNLVINSAQAISEQVDGSDRRGRIAIATRVEDDDAVVEIADNGPGIPPELQDRIHEPFFTTKEIGQGSGQGLALARTTMEQHSGSIECTSAPDEGTTFTLRIPLNSAAADVPRAA